MKFKFLIALMLLAFAAVPVLAQEETTTNDVTFNGFSFTYDSAMASNVNISIVAAEPADSPFTPEAAHTQFLFYSGYPAPESFLDGEGAIRVYRTEDILGNEARESQLIMLQSLLAQRPDLTPNMVGDTSASVTLPFIPIFAAGQVMRARAQYVETDAVEGISYLTIYRQDIGPFIASEVLYTFQGLSSDGQYYISVMLHADPNVLPAEYEVIDPTTFDMTAYTNDVIAQLNAAAPEDFAPSLTVLDALVQSFAFAQ